jgi:RNA polymerase sigma-70 factor, ECF subfamily
MVRSWSLAKLGRTVTRGVVSPLRPPIADREPREASPAEAIANLYEQYAQVVADWIYGLMGPYADVEDLVHDTFLIAHRKRFDFRGEATVKTWLFGIMAYVVANRRKRESVRRWLLMRFAKDDGTRAASPMVPIEEMLRRERVARLYRALDKLPDIYRTALILFEIEGLPGNEIAELVGIDVETLWVRLHRGRAKLLALMSKEGQP